MQILSSLSFLAVAMKFGQVGTLKKCALTVIGVHFFIAVFHGIAHQELPVDLSAVQLAFVIVVIMISPIVSGGLIIKSARAGSLLLLLSMLAALIFGLYFHFVADSPDNISHMTEMPSSLWPGTFKLTAYVLALIETLGAFVGGLLYFGRQSAQRGHT